MGLFARVKTWVLNETIKTADLNGEFNNLINNMIPTSIVGYEATVPQMRAQTDPGSQGSEIQGASLADEIERLRFVINRAFGGTYWYDNPNTSLQALQTQLSSAIGFAQNRIVSGRVDANSQPMYLTPDTGSNAVVKLKAASTALSIYIKNSLVTVNSDLSASLTGPAAFTLAVNDATLTAQQSSKTQGENGTVLTVDTPSGSAPAVGSYQAWKIVHSATTEYFFGRYASSTQIDKVSRGNFFNNLDASISRLAIADNDVITLCRAAYIFLTNVAGVAALAVTYDEPIVSYTQPTSPAAGDWWLDLSAGGIWKIFSGGTFIDGVGTMVGMAVVDGSNVVAARSKAFDRSFSDLNTISLELADVATIQSANQNARISVYGNSYEYPRTTIKWATPGQLDSGVTIGNSLKYYLYVSDKGQPFISDVAPYDSRATLLGYYHPSKPWRAVGYFISDGSANFQTPVNQDTFGVSVGSIDQTRLGVAPQSPTSLENLLTVSGLTLTNAYQDVPDTMGGSFTISATGRPVLLSVNLGFINGDAAPRTCYLQILRGATVLRTYMAAVSASGAGVSKSIYDTFIDKGATGSTKYKLQVKFDGTSGSANNLQLSQFAGISESGNFAKLVGDQSSTGSTPSKGIRAIEGIEL